MNTSENPRERAERLVRWLGRGISEERLTDLAEHAINEEIEECAKVAADVHRNGGSAEDAAARIRARRTDNE